jgi:hypothetical protein
MRVWSKGLGRMALYFDFSEATIMVEEGGNLPATNVKVEIVKGNPVICGKTKDPVIWEFKIWLERSDVPSLVKIALSKLVVKFIIEYYVKRFLMKFSLG